MKLCLAHFKYLNTFTINIAVMLTEYMKLWAILNSLCKSSQYPGDSISTSDANLYKCAVVPDIKNACTDHNYSSYVTCHTDLILTNHVSPEDISGYAQRSCCLLSIPTFHKFTININPDLENKIRAKGNCLKNRFSLTKRFTVCFSLPTILTWLLW